jgi:hypothetical protein
MESLEESLEFFSPEGKPLRASMSFALSQQKITEFVFRPTQSPPPGANRSASGTGGAAGTPPGTKPLSQASDKSSLQSMAAAEGRQDQWQQIALANNIENPRLLQPGQLVDLNPPSISGLGGPLLGIGS